MRSRFITSTLLAVFSSMAAAADVSGGSSEPLYVLSVRAAPAEDGKPLTMTVRETKRTPEFSTVDVEYVAGGSAASLFMVRGLCGVMQARGRKLAVAEQVSENPVRFLMTFPESAKVEAPSGLPRMVLSEADCARVQAPHE